MITLECPIDPNRELDALIYGISAFYTDTVSLYRLFTRHTIAFNEATKIITPIHLVASM